MATKASQPSVAALRFDIVAGLAAAAVVLPKAMAYSTVLQAQEQLFPQELNLIATRAQLLGAAVAIYRATGGGWVTEADKLAAQPVAGDGWFARTLPPGRPASQASAPPP
jgi:hypothetical protein